MKSFPDRHWIVLCVLAFCFGFGTVYAADAQADLIRALESSRSANFKAVHKRKRNTEAAEWAYTVFYQLRSPDFEEDQFVYRRIDFIMPMISDYESEQSIIQSNRQNLSGAFQCAGKNIAIKAKQPLDWWPKIAPEEKGISVKAGGTEKYREIPCRKYILTIGKESPFYGQVSEIVYLAGQENDFIYRWVVYGPKKKILGSLEFGEVDFQAEIPLALFDLPVAAKAVEANSMEEVRMLLDSASAMGTQMTEYLQQLRKAMEESHKKSFTAKAKELNGAGKEVWQAYYQWFDAETEILYQRLDLFSPGNEIEYSDPDIISQSNRSCPDGFFYCYGKYAIKMKYFGYGAKAFYIPAILHFTNAPLTITRRNVDHNGMPCYEYIVRYPADYPREPDAGTTVKYIVGRELDFVYAWTQYDASGKRFNNCNLLEIDFAPDLPRSFFFPDKGTKIYVVNSQAEFRSVQKDVFRKRADDYRKRHSGSRGMIRTKALIGFILKHGVWVTLSIAALAIMAAVVIKIRFRK